MKCNTAHKSQELIHFNKVDLALVSLNVMKPHHPCFTKTYHTNLHAVRKHQMPHNKLYNPKALNMNPIILILILALSPYLSNSTTHSTGTPVPCSSSYYSLGSHSPTYLQHGNSKAEPNSEVWQLVGLPGLTLGCGKL